MKARGLLSERELQRALLLATVKAGSISAWARANGCLRERISDMLRGARPVSTRTAELLGYRELRVFKRKEKGR